MTDLPDSIHGNTPAEANEHRVKVATDAVCAFDPDAAAYRHRTEAWVRVVMAATDADFHKVQDELIDALALLRECRGILTCLLPRSPSLDLIPRSPYLDLIARIDKEIANG